MIIFRILIIKIHKIIIIVSILEIILKWDITIIIRFEISLFGVIIDII